MNAPDILVRLHAVGVSLSRRGDKLIATPKAAVTPEILDLIRAHKPELLSALTDPLPDPAAEARRQRVLAMLADHPEARCAVLSDMRADPGVVLLTMAIRGVATCELRIPREKYDGVLLLDLIERHGETIH